MGPRTELVWVKMVILYLCPEHCKMSIVSHKAHIPTAQEVTAVSLFLVSMAFFPGESLKTKDGF